MAEETPHATVLDHRVREANYNDRQVYEIPGVFRIATEIVFAKAEVVEHVALGDTVYWEVAPAANSLFIKPRAHAGRTNLDRKSAGEGKSGSVREDRGGRRTMTKK